jgi:ATP-dependent exoDNAse (exonuclease V) beta subunit
VSGPAADDSPARAAIRHQLDATQFVEAGAGTGKTTALVGRIVELVASGRARMGEIAAMTFTEAAAGELRDRIAEALERSAAGTDGDDHPDAHGADRLARRERARQALAEMDAAAISTLHGFARRVLAAYPFEAALPPMLDVLDEVRSTVAFDERWSAFMEELLQSDADQKAMLTLLTCGVRLPQLRDVALQFDENWDLVADAVLRPPPIPPVGPAAVLAPLEAATAAAASCRTDDDKLYMHIERLAPFMSTLRAVDGELDTLRVLVDAQRMSTSVGQQGNWDQGRCDAIRDMLRVAQDARDDLVAGVANAALANLLVSVRALTLRSADDRRNEGRLEFHDLLVLSRQLVRHRPDVCSRLRTQFRYLLIDEFQDTDPVQVELAVRIASEDPEASQKNWTELSVPPGRLFFVGDPKQSIYRFRRADIALFLATRDRYVDAPLLLSRNRRSVPGIIEWVNAVFADLMGAGAPGAQPAYQALTAHRSDHVGLTGAPPVVLLGDPVTGGVPVNVIRQCEGDDIAAVVHQIIDERWPVGDDARPARLADITILVPSRTGLGILVGALDAADVAYRLESSSLVYAAPEVRELLAVLRAVDDPTDEVAIVAALRSALFGCGDDDLLDYKLRQGSWDYRAKIPDDIGGDHPVAVGQRALAAFHDERWWYEVSGLIEKIVQDRRVYELALADSRPREMWRRLRFVADQSRQFTDAFGGDIRRYLAWAELQSVEGARVTEVILPETDHDAVRIMTVHAAKGLEFPIVVLAGLNAARPHRTGAQVLWGERGPEVSVTARVRTAGFESLAADERQMEDYERLRLLYVAATRARDHLVVSLHHKATAEPNCHAAFVEAVCGEHPELWRRCDARGGPEERGRAQNTEVGGGRVPASTSGLADVGDGPGPRQRWIAERAERLRRAAIPRTVAATAVARLAGLPVKGSDEADTADAADAVPSAESGEAAVDGDPRSVAPWRRGRGGTALGRAVHATLQLVDLGTGADLTMLARTQAVAEGIVDRAPEVAGLVEVALRSDVIRAAVAHGRYSKEIYVGAPVGRRVLEGFVDLLVEHPDGLEVVDYKTDSASGGELDEIFEGYRMQGAAYAVAVERALGRPVTRCTFLFLRPEAALARSIPDLAEAKRQVQEALGA